MTHFIGAMFQCNCEKEVPDNYRVEVAFSTVNTKNVVRHYVCLTCSIRLIALSSPYARVAEKEEPRKNIITFKHKGPEM